MSPPYGTGGSGPSLTPNIALPGNSYSTPTPPPTRGEDIKHMRMEVLMQIPSNQGKLLDGLCCDEHGARPSLCSPTLTSPATNKDTLQSPH